MKKKLRWFGPAVTVKGTLAIMPSVKVRVEGKIS